jgi:uncharacterized protein DUF4150
MGATIGVNPPKTPVTAGSQGKAPASVPNVCKMPGPPAPFVPTPLPNLGRSEDSPDGYTTTVLFEGKTVAIKGATFKSTGSPDAASKATGGGIISSVEEGKTGFSAPGSMNVKAEGKNIQLLGDAMLNNGSNPFNAATAPGELQLSETEQALADLLCEEFCKEVAKPGKKTSYALEQRLQEAFGEGGDVQFPPESSSANHGLGAVLGTVTSPDCIFLVGGDIVRCYDFKFECNNDRWRGNQWERQKEMAKGADPVTISETTCGC